MKRYGFGETEPYCLALKYKRKIFLIEYKQNKKSIIFFIALELVSSFNLHFLGSIRKVAKNV